MLEILKTIILACQVTGSYSGGTYSTKTYENARIGQIKCQKELIKCVGNTGSDGLKTCLLEREEK